MYSMNACIGSDLSGEMANSQAFFVLSSSCELSASAVDMADADVVTAEDDLPEPLPYKIGKSGAKGVHVSVKFRSFVMAAVYIGRTFGTSGKPGGGGSLSRKDNLRRDGEGIEQPLTLDSRAGETRS
jgi:hypothetical protein